MRACPCPPARLANPLTPAATVAHHLGGSGGGLLPGGTKPPTATSPKAVWNTAVTNTTTQALEALLAMLRQNPALVFPTAYFKRMKLEGGSGVRLVPTPAFVSVCEGAPRQQRCTICLPVVCSPVVRVRWMRWATWQHCTAVQQARTAGAAEQAP